MRLLLLSILALLLFTAAACADKPADFSESLNRFGFRVLADLDKQQNVIISPVSLGMVMGSLQGACTAEQKRSISDALQMKETVINAGNKKLMEEAKSLEDIDLETANAIWLDEDLSPSEVYSKFLARYYSSALKNISFSDTSGAAGTINGWCSENTKGFIDRVVSERDLEGCRVLLANALYFKANWYTTFKPQNTYKDDFRPYSAPEYEVWMMHRTGSMRYDLNENYVAVSLPYKNPRFAMDIVVPRDEKAMKAFLRSMAESGQSPFFDKEYGDFDSVELSMPVFEVSCKNNLLDLLKKYGLKDTGYTRMLAGGQEVQINGILQSVKVKADETGTEAAAVTAAVMGLTSAIVPRVSVDRPFVFNIYDTEKGTVYFTGIVYSPDPAGEREKPKPEPLSADDSVAPPLGGFGG
ncbi:MAG: hypothetical protein IJT95_04360 [Abditibacteriota bacterium]|nr:hypothetical protein [Abditibacteriota bacterium]